MLWPVSAAYEGTNKNLYFDNTRIYLARVNYGLKVHHTLSEAMHLF